MPIKSNDRPNADFKSGFVSIIGAPNAGKSTLLNRMLGQKISITSKKPQTTRNRIIGVVPEKGVWYRVRIGYYGSKTEAAAMMKKLQEGGFKPYLVNR